MITVGGFFANCSRRVSPPRIATSSSLTILMTCWAGFSARDTSSPSARSLTAAMNSRTTGSATSASSRAMRISRAVASMSASDSRPLPRSPVNTAESRSERVSNTPPAYGALARHGRARAGAAGVGAGMIAMCQPRPRSRPSVRPVDRTPAHRRRHGSLGHRQVDGRRTAGRRRSAGRWPRAMTSTRRPTWPRCTPATRSPTPTGRPGSPPISRLDRRARGGRHRAASSPARRSSAAIATSCAAATRTCASSAWSAATTCSSRGSRIAPATSCRRRCSTASSRRSSRSQPDEPGATIDVSAPPAQIEQAALAALGHDAGSPAG